MDLTPYLPWLKYLHVVAVLLFVAGHGVSMFVVFRVRHETDPSRMLALLDLSAWSLGVAGIGMLAVLVTGIVDGVVRAAFGQAWIWLSLVLFVVVGGLMTPLAGKYTSGLREALGQRTRRLKPADPDPVALGPEAVAALATQSRAPELTAVVGAGGIVVLLWLMTFKPF